MGSVLGSAQGLGVSLDPANLYEVVQTLALAIAAVVFILRWSSGFFYVNLSLSLSTDRSKAGEASDYLIVTAFIAKENYAAIELHDAKARVSWHNQSGPNSVVKELVGIYRLITERLNGVVKVTEWKKSRTAPLLQFPPHDRCHFACYFEVPSNAVCTVEVVVIGLKRNAILRRRPQWRVSSISIPVASPSPAELCQCATAAGAHYGAADPTNL